MFKSLLAALLLVATSAHGALVEIDKQQIVKINELKNGGFENGKAGWVASGGTFTASSTTPIKGALSGVWDSNAAAQTLRSESVTVSPAMSAAGVVVSCRASVASGTATHTIGIWDGASLVQSQPLASSVTAANNILFFQPSTATIKIQITSVNANEPSIKIDACAIGVYDSVAVGPVTTWQQYTPVFQGFGTPGDIELYWRQVGENIEIKGHWAGFTPTAVEGRLGLPNGHTITTTQTEIEYAGAITYLNGADAYPNLLAQPGASYLTFGVLSGASDPFAPLQGNQITSGGKISIYAKVQVAGLSSTTPAIIVNPNIGPWNSYVPTFTGLGTVSSPAVYWRQVGESIEIQGNVTSGTATAAAATFTLPNNYVIGSSIASNSYVGVATRDNAAGGTYSVIATAPAAQTLGFGSVAGTNGLAVQNGNNILTSGDVLSFNAKVQIAGLAANGVLNAGQVAYLKDVKSTGTDGGGFTSGAWQTRDLNSESDPDAIVTVSANQFTLQAGKYRINAHAPAYSVGQHQAKLRNVTDSTDDLIGESAFNDSALGVQTDSVIKGIITLSAAKTFEIQHQCGVTQATNGYGVANSFGLDEIYTQVEIERIK